jgi:copper chaperone
MKRTIKVENIKCGGCAGHIDKILQAKFPVKNIVINIETGEISFEAEANYDLKAIKKELLNMGYPEIGTLTGISSAAKKAKSFISCAIGKVENKMK